MIDVATLQPGDILYSDEHPKRSILIVHIQPSALPFSSFDVWWLDRTTVNGHFFDMRDRYNNRPIGPWTTGETVGFHRERK